MTSKTDHALRTTADHVVILSTAGSPEEAQRIAKALIERRLVACVNIVPGVSSKYWWKGKVEEAAEVLLVMKSRRQDAEAIATALRSAHSYEVPEVLVLPVEAGLRSYLDWIDETVRGAER